MSQSVSTFSQRMGTRETYNNDRLLSAQRSLRPVLIHQIHSMSSHSSDITDLYLHQTYVYLVKIVGGIESKHATANQGFTEYVVSDRTGRITCKIWQNDHGFEVNDKIGLIGKIFKENHETKIGIHHMELLFDDHRSEMQLHETEVQYDELVSDMKRNQPQIYQQYLDALMKEKREYEREHYSNLNRQNEPSYSFHDHDAPPGFAARPIGDSGRSTQTLNPTVSHSVRNNECFRSQAIEMRNQRQRANSFAPNDNNNNYNYNVMQVTPIENRRKSAPYHTNNNSNCAQGVNEDVERINIIFGIIDTLFGLKKEDVSVYDIMQKTRFQASNSQIYQYLRVLEDDGRIFSTHDQNHWRPVS